MTTTDTINTAEVSKEGGELWYVRPSGRRERLSSYLRKNVKRMWVNGVYIPTTHPLHKPGRYKSLDDAWSHQKIEQTQEGEIYAITNGTINCSLLILKMVKSTDTIRKEIFFPLSTLLIPMMVAKVFLVLMKLFLE